MCGRVCVCVCVCACTLSQESGYPDWALCGDKVCMSRSKTTPGLAECILPGSFQRLSSVCVCVCVCVCVRERVSVCVCCEALQQLQDSAAVNNIQPCSNTALPGVSPPSRLCTNHNSQGAGAAG